MHRFLLLSFAAGCVFAPGPARYTYSPASATQHTTAKPDSCTFDMLTTTPARSFDELGVLDLFDGGGQGPPHNIEVFRRLVAPHVCKSGGDAVIAFANGYGNYIKGTVLRYTDTAAAAAPTP